MLEKDVQDKLKIYEALLHKWQQKINLVSSKTLHESWKRHFEDSIQIIDYLPAGAKALFDLGSGAGFPGLVLAISRPDLDVHLVESDQKKCAFLKTVSRETGVAVTVHSQRIEDVSCETIPDVITARALASLPDLFDYCRRWVKVNPELILIFPKGARAEEELAELSKNWSYECRTYLSTTEPEAQILSFSNVRPL